MIYSKYSSRAVSLLAFLPLILNAQRAQENLVPLKNWATPLNWQPNKTETKAGGLLPRSDGLPASTVPTFLTFVAMTPCRLVDTRGGAQGFIGVEPFSGPSLLAGGLATFLVQSSAEASTTAPAPCGAIPTIAAAYSLNLTVVPQAGGPVNFVQIWPAGVPQPTYVSAANDLQGDVVANTAIVAAGTPFGGISVFNYGPAIIDVVIDLNGYFASPTDVSGNTAIGPLTLTSNTEGYGNVAIGSAALELNTSGGYNTATGIYALSSNTTGGSNTATGQSALANNTTASFNTAYGSGALEINNIGPDNTAIGYQALTATANNDNTAVGYQALLRNTSGANNIAIGSGAGGAAPAGNSDSIYIGSSGTGSDTAGSIQIGTQGAETTGAIHIGRSQAGGTSIAGIYNGTPNVFNLPVCVDANGVLGTAGCSIALSSIQFKDQIADMGDSSNKLLQLRPVTFLYKPQYDDGSHALQYGLIAEEVAKLYPGMVGYDKAGQPTSVKYQLLAPMLLNEVQKQAGQLREQAEQNGQQAEQLHSLEDRLAALESSLAAAPEPVR